MAQITVRSAQLTAAAAGLRGVGRTLDEEFAKAAKKAEPKFRALVFSKASTRIERRIIAQRVRLAVRNGGIRLESKGGSLRNGLNAEDHGGAVEFGVNRGKVTTYTRGGKRGGRVRRHTARQLRPFNKTGYVFTPAVKAFVPVLKKELVGAAADAIESALTGKG